MNIGDGNTDKLELFKYDGNDKGWIISNPYGRDISEFGRVAGAILDEQLGGDLLALGTGLFETAKRRFPVPMWMRVALGNWLGLKTKKANEALHGHGEEEFKEGIGDVNWGKFWTFKKRI